MTKQILFVALAIVTLSARTQNLSLDDLITLQKSGLAEMTDFLANKGWEFHSSTLPANDKYGEISFAHSRQEVEDKASAWLNILYADSVATRVMYQSGSREVYQSFKNKIAAYGMEQSGQTLSEGSISTSYTGKNYGVIISHTTTGDYNSPVYVFSLYEKNDYLIDRYIRSLKE